MAAGAELTVDVHLSAADLRAALKHDVRTGLAATPRSIPPVWFYDERGSRLFEEITTLPEYYPTRAERELLVAHARAVAALAHADTLVELGAGSCDKTRVLLDAMASYGPLRRYVPFDVSDEFLCAAAAGVSADYGGLEVRALVGDFQQHLDRVPVEGRRLVAFLGGTIGNLRPEERQRFFSTLEATLLDGDHFLLGTDLRKDTRRMIAAYDDNAGVTAAFNKNVLLVINRQLGADFEPDHFQHVARWNPEKEWMEMWLRSTTDQVVWIRDLQMVVPFVAGEELLTEISAKFTPDRLAVELEAAGFAVEGMWGIDKGDFLLTLARPAT